MISVRKVTDGYHVERLASQAAVSPLCAKVVQPAPIKGLWPGNLGKFERAGVRLCKGAA